MEGRREREREGGRGGERGREGERWRGIGGSRGKERVVCEYMCAFKTIDWFLWWLLMLLCCGVCLHWPLLFLFKLC